jgi:hypothetical protein
VSEIDKRPSRLLALPLALAFLFETWVWRWIVVLARALAALLPWVRFRNAARREVARAPAFVAVVLFGVPLAVAEGGAFISVVTMATGHLFAGMALYVLMKIFGLFLIPVIFEITREKLMMLPWFVWCYEKFDALHAMAARFVAPYRQRARELVREGWLALRERFQPRARSDDIASAAKAETSTSSARTVGSSPASPNH